jgi:hypothetical protein
MRRGRGKEPLQSFILCQAFKKPYFRLCCMLTLAFLLGMALAETGRAADHGDVAVIGERAYGTLEEAVKAAESGDVIEIRKSLKLDKTLVLDRKKNLILDFSGKTLTYSGSKTAISVKAGRVSIRGGKILCRQKENGAISVDVKKNACAALYHGSFEGTVRNFGLLEISGGSYESGAAFVSVNNLGKCLIDGGTFRNEISNYGNLTIAGGKFAPRVSSSLTNGGTCVIRDGIFTAQVYQAEGKMTIRGGSFSYKDEEVQIDVYRGTLLITDGRFRAYGVAPNLHVGKKAKVRISGGFFRTDRSTRAGNILDEGKLTVTGGTFDRDIDVVSAEQPKIGSGVKVKISYG